MLSGEGESYGDIIIFSRSSGSGGRKTMVTSTKSSNTRLRPIVWLSRGFGGKQMGPRVALELAVVL